MSVEHPTSDYARHPINQLSEQEKCQNHMKTVLKDPRDLILGYQLCQGKTAANSPIDVNVRIISMPEIRFKGRYYP